MNLWDYIVTLVTLPFRSRPTGERYVAFIERTKQPNLLETKNGSFLSTAEHIVDGVTIKVVVMDGFIITQTYFPVTAERAGSIVAALPAPLSPLEESEEGKKWGGKNCGATYQKKEHRLLVNSL